jgi:hypothetical protein
LATHHRVANESQGNERKAKRRVVVKHPVLQLLRVFDGHDAGTVELSAEERGSEELGTIFCRPAVVEVADVVLEVNRESWCRHAFAQTPLLHGLLGRVAIAHAPEKG